MRSPSVAEIQAPYRNCLRASAVCRDRAKWQIIPPARQRPRGSTFIFLIGRLLTFAIRPVVTFAVNSEVRRLGVGIPISSRRLRSPSIEPRKRGTAGPISGTPKMAAVKSRAQPMKTLSYGPRTRACGLYGKTGLSRSAQTAASPEHLRMGAVPGHQVPVGVWEDLGKLALPAG